MTASRLSAGGFVLVVEDLTEVVRAQKASAWREVARRLAHEIKNPLTPIQLSAERIARNIARLPAASPRVATVIQECVGAIVDEVSSLKHLVDEFVRFARLPAVSRVPNSMKDLVDEHWRFTKAGWTALTLSVDIAGGSAADPHGLDADEARPGQPDRQCPGSAVRASRTGAADQLRSGARRHHGAADH